MTRRVGLPTASKVKAKDQLHKVGYDETGVQSLPSPYAAGYMKPGDVGIKDPGSPITFIVRGDMGGIKNPTPQENVNAEIERRLASSTPPAFILDGGDVCYFNGDADQYAPQFGEPNAHLEVPIIAIPGNHDGDTTDDPSRLPLDTFMAAFVTKTPSQPPWDPQNEYGRDTQTQPSHDWSLELEALTIVGAYSNVASGGHFFPEQIEWLTEAVRTARTSLPLIFDAHHPGWSIDAHHGGSAAMVAYFHQIFDAAGRWPNLILSHHVHDMQSFSITLPSGQVFTDIVMGCSGYPNRHPIAGDYTPGMDLGGGVICNYADGDNYGFLELTVVGQDIRGEYAQVAPITGAVTPNAYSFSVQ